MKPLDLIRRLKTKADEIDRSVSRTKNDRDGEVFGEIELMREAAAMIEIITLQTPPNSLSILERLERLESAVLELNPGLNWTR